MQVSLRSELIRAFTDPKTVKITAAILLLNLIIFSSGWFYVFQYFSCKPCVICGRPNTTPVKTLWQYEVKVVPYCKDVVLWYCPLHIKNAPPLVSQIPSPKDTVVKRFVLAVIGGMIQLITLFYALVLMKFGMKYLIISPLVISSAFLIGRITSSLSLTVLFGSIAIIPLTFLYGWMKKKPH